MNLFEWVRGLFGRRNYAAAPDGVIKKEFDARPAASRLMEDHRRLWWDLYTNHPPWESCDVRPLGIPEAIGKELRRYALAEFSASVSGGERGEYINEQLQRALGQLPSALELGLCLGGVALKPYPDENRILVDVVSTGFTPTCFDGEGRVTGGVFKSQPVRVKNRWYVRLEYHHFSSREEGGNLYVIENKAFSSGEDGTIGGPVPLSTVPEWAALQPRAEIEGLEQPLFACFKPPSANAVEPGSPVGVSVYAGPTAELIRQADEKWEQIEWEYQSGQRKIYADDRTDGPAFINDRLFVFGSFTNDGDLFHEFSPEFRDEPLYRGFQRILQRIEFNVGLAYGTLSDPQSVEKTATEILAAKQRQYVTVGEIQKALQETLDGLIYAMNAWCDLDRLAPAGNYEVSYSWGDGVLDDPETRRQDMSLDMQRVAAGLMTDVAFVMKWDKVDEETARKLLPELEELAAEPEEEIE